jgi:hypothetical protein
LSFSLIKQKISQPPFNFNPKKGCIFRPNNLGGDNRY